MVLPLCPLAPSHFQHFIEKLKPTKQCLCCPIAFAERKKQLEEERVSLSPLSQVIITGGSQSRNSIRAGTVFKSDPRPESRIS